MCRDYQDSVPQMTRRHTALVWSVAALCLLSATLFEQGWPLVGVWAAPLIGALCWGTGDAWLFGALWGIITGGIPSGGFLLGLCSLASSGWAYGTVLPFYLFWCGAWGALWFGSLAYIISAWRQGSIGAVVSALVGVWGYSLCASLWSPVVDPLVPFVEHPALLWMAPFLGAPLTLLCVLGIQAAATHAYMAQSAWSGSIAGVGSILWIAGALGMVRDSGGHTQELLARRCGLIYSYFGNDESYEDTLRHVAVHCKALREVHPELACIVLPESSLYHGEFFEPWYRILGTESMHAKPFDQMSIVAGGFCKEVSTISNDCCYNTAWFIGNRKIVDHFHKRATLPVSESLPVALLRARAWGFGWLYELYFSRRHYIVTEEPNKRGARPAWQLFPGCIVVPYICSELFFAQRPDDPYTDLMILALCNSSWVGAQEQWMMARLVKFRALLWQRDILYVAHSFAGIYTAQGGYYPLPAECQPCY